MKKLVASLWAILLGGIVPSIAFCASTSDYKAVPPFIQENSPKANVLIILDNSNSMDEDVDGAAVGSDAPDSRSEIARNAVETMITNFGSVLRIGLMAYRQSNISLRHIHNSPYYVSYDPDTYDPAGSFTPQDARTNTKRIENPSNPGHYIYYDQNLPFYAGSDCGIQYCYSTNFEQGRTPIPPGSMNDHISDDNPYKCRSTKVGTNDVYSNNSHVNDAVAIAEYAGSTNTYSFGLTDSDVAAGFYQIGAQMTWSHVGMAWMSTSAPGGGMLHVAVDDLDATQATALQNKLAVCQFSVATDTPIRNAGFTPLYSTLGSAKDYFEGDLASAYAASGVSRTTPTTYECQKNFVVLVTDGLPTEDPYGTGDFITPVADAATALRTTTISIDGTDTIFDIQTFVLGFALPRGMNGALDPVAVAAGTDIDGSAYYAGSEAELVAALNDLFLEILDRTSSGTASSVISASREGDGAVFQAVFQPTMKAGADEVTWTGDVHAFFIDSNGYMRESQAETDGSQELDDTTEDPIITMCYNTTDRIVRVNKSTSIASIPTESQCDTCSAADFPYTLSDVDYLWSAGECLAGLTDTQATTQRTYTSTTGRYIMTAIDTDGDGLIAKTEAVAFVPGSFTNSNAGLLQAADATEAGAIVDYVRGDDQSYRSREIDYDGNGSTETWRLGDIVYSTPVAVAAPAEDFDLLYADLSYLAFVAHHRNRRQVVYAGANDGMLHAFNAGWYDSANKAFEKGYSGKTQYDLGEELWAYVPYNVLPHLKYLTNSGYGSTSGDHVYYVDLKPRVFDAKIFTADASHTNGWGTILVGGMRFGGGQIDVDVDTDNPGTDVRTLRSSFFILDITDPESPPEVLLEFTHSDLGYTTAIPTPVKVGNDWYLMLGSGPYPTDSASLNAAKSTQTGKLFLIDLSTMSLETTFGTSGVLALSDANSFVSDLIAADYDLDFSTDAVYFGTVSGTGAPWSGNVQRVRIQNEATPTYYSPSLWASSVLYNTTKPIIAAPAIGVDKDGNRWVFSGSGRFFVRTDADDSSQQSFFGIREPYSIVSDEKVFDWSTVSLPFEDVSNVSYYENYSVSLAAFNSLKSLMAGNTKGGWLLNFSTSKERNLGQASLLGEILTFTTYVPSSAVCAFEGTSSLYALYYSTGTAYIESVIGLDTGDSVVEDGKTKYKVLKKRSLGVGMTTMPSIHSGGEEGSKAYIQTSTGAILTLDELNPGMVKSGQIAWQDWQY